MGGQGTMYLGVGADTRGAEAGIKRVKDQVQGLRRSFAQAGQAQRSLQRYGAPALSALSAGFSAASSAADGFNTSMAAVATSMLSAFASGGAGGLAIAGISGVIGLIVANTQASAKAAQQFREELEKSNTELDKAAETMSKRLLEAQAKMIEAQTMGRLKAADIVRLGVEGAERKALVSDISSQQTAFDRAKREQNEAYLAIRTMVENMYTSSAMQEAEKRRDFADQNYKLAAQALGKATLALEQFEERLRAERLAAEAVAGMAPPTTVAGAVAATGFGRRTMGGGSIHEFVGVAGGDLPMTEDQGDDLIEVTRRIERNTANPPAARAR